MQVVTANRLADGVVIFLADGGAWCERIADGRIAESKAEADELMRIAEQAVAGCRIVEPYLIDVLATEAGLVPTKLRERIRAAGPTVRTDLGKQAGKGQVRDVSL